MMDSFDLAFMVDELIQRMIARGLSIEDMKNATRILDLKIQEMKLECEEF